MGIDYGPSLKDQLIQHNYLRSTSGGYLLTEEGVNFLFSGLQELYHEISKLRNNKACCKYSTVNDPSDIITRSDDSAVQSE